MHPQGIESTIDKIFITATVDQQFTQKKTQHVQDIQFLSFSNIHDNVILILFITLTKYIYPLIKKTEKKNNQPFIANCQFYRNLILSQMKACRTR